MCYDDSGDDMKDIPMFTTDYGVASIILKEVPYRGLAYVRVRDTQPGELVKLMEECVTFCRMAGAETVLAEGHPELERYPLHHSVLTMSGPGAYEAEANLWPVTGETAAKWREIYNRRMADVDGAATMTAQDEKEIAQSAGTYFVHREGKLLGIGWVDDGQVRCVAGVEPGAGRAVLQTLLTSQTGDRISLEVASTNAPAIRLYESMGFVQTGERTRWHQVL